MRNHLLKSLVIAMSLLALPMRFWGQDHDGNKLQQVHLTDYENGFLFNVFQIESVEERIQLASALATSDIWICNPTDNPGELFIRPNSYYADIPIYAEFDYLRMTLKEEYQEASSLPKEEFGDIFNSWAQNISSDFYNFLISDKIGDRANHCADAEPFCTTDVYNFPALNSGYSWAGPNYGCLGSSPTTKQSFWYYMRVGVAGNITIKIEASFDVDFALWGPFSNEIDPCPTSAGQAGLLTANCSNCPNNTTSPNFYPSGNLHDCSYSGQSYEYAHVVNGQVGQYFILLITNFAGGNGNITFQKYAGNGETDCGIMPPLVENGGPYCVGETITLTGNAQAGATYSWSGPGNWTASGQTVTRPNCNLSMSGDYTCTIHVGDQSNSAVTRVQVYPKPTANFTATSVCLGNSTQFTNSSTTNPANQAMTYHWNFGDGQTSTQQNPSYQFATAGNHTVTLTVSCGNGACTSTKTQTVTVYPNPVANAGPDQTIPYGSTAQLNGTGGNGTFNYHWEPADKVVNPNAQNTQTVGLTESTTFTLTVTHPQGGCSSTDEMSVLLQGSNMTATANASPSTICLGESSQLNAIAIGGTGNYTYSWSPSIGLSDPLSGNPIATPSQTTTYTCTVNDGYTTKEVSTTITVNNPEYEEVTEYTCPDEPFNFYGTDYTDEGDYNYVTTTAQGCEKIITLHLRHYTAYDNAHTTTEYICPNTSYYFHGQYYSSTGRYPAHLETTHGCDSIVWLNLTVYPANDTIIVDPTICTSQTYNFHGTEYNQDGDIAYFDTIDNHGCLLVEKLMLSVGPYQMPPKEEPRVCVAHDDTPSYYWDKTGQTYTQDAEDEIILPDPNGGCDIKYRLNLKFHREFYQSDTLTVCDSYQWPVVPGSNYTSTNHHIVKTFNNTGGQGFDCDSTYVLNLTVNHSNNSEVTVLNQCDQYEWQFGWNNESHLLTEQGDYTKVIDTYLGCDSTVTMHLQLDYTPDFPLVEGKPWVVGGSEFQYTIERYWIDTHPNSTHSTEWGLYDVNGEPFYKWDLMPYDNGDKCLVYIYTFERDSVEIRAHTQSSGECDCGEFTKSKWIHCSYYDVEENISHCEADIYPNPNDGTMTLSLDNMTGNVDVKVYNITGALVDQLSLYNGYGHQTHEYQSNRLTQGIYFFQFTCKEGRLTKKVIVFE